MNLGKYPSAVYGLAEEILYGFSEDDIEAIYGQLREMGFRGWLDWKNQNHKLLVDYIEATPSQRSKLKKFKSNMHLIAFGAYQHCMAGYKFLHEIEANLITPGQSYRGMASSAANAYQEISNAIEHELWPWDRDPFGYDT